MTRSAPYSVGYRIWIVHEGTITEIEAGTPWTPGEEGPEAFTVIVRRRDAASMAVFDVDEHQMDAEQLHDLVKSQPGLVEHAQTEVSLDHRGQVVRASDDSQIHRRLDAFLDPIRSPRRPGQPGVGTGA